MHQHQQPGKTIDESDDQCAGQICDTQQEGIFQIIEKGIVKLTNQGENIAQNQNAVDENGGADQKQEISEGPFHTGKIYHIHAAYTDYGRYQQKNRGALFEIFPKCKEVCGKNLSLPGRIQAENHIVQGGKGGSNGENRDAGQQKQKIQNNQAGKAVHEMHKRGIKFEKCIHNLPRIAKNVTIVYRKRSAIAIISREKSKGSPFLLCILPGRKEGNPAFPFKVPKSGFPGIFCVNLVDKCPPQEYNSVLLLNEI